MATPASDRTPSCQLNTDDVCEAAWHVHSYDDAVPMTDKQIRRFLNEHLRERTEIIERIYARWNADVETNRQDAVDKERYVQWANSDGV